MRRTSGRMVAAGAAALGLWLSGCFLNGGAFDAAGTGGAGTTDGTGATAGTGATSSQGGSSTTPTTTTTDSGTTATGGDGGAGGSGGSTTTTTTTATTTGPLCGNGLMEGDEECDDNNNVEGDGCHDCKRDCGCTGCQAGTACANCPVSGQTTFKDQVSKHCYVFDGTPKNWQDARSACQGLGTGWDLMAPSTVMEMGMLLAAPGFLIDDHLSNTNNRLFTGGTDQAVEGTFVWTNGEAWHEPPDGLAQQAVSSSDDCLALGQSGGVVTLRGRSCTSDPFAYACEYTP